MHRPRGQTLARFVALLAVTLTACWSSPSSSPAGAGGGDSTSQGSGASSGTSGGASTSTGSGSTGGAGPTAPGGYYTMGNTIYDADGNVHIFRGVARPSLEWNVNGENLSAQDYQRMAGWGANVVRIAVNQGFWLNGSTAYAPAYEGTIDQNIDWALAAGLDVILDLHWSDRGDFGTWPDQQRMADQNSILFWQQVATKYKDDGRILFELYNEPHDITWDVWRNGGPSGDGFNAVGMQQLYDTVRATGANNLVILGGVHWAYDLSGVPSHAITGHNIVYATHLYNFPDKLPPAWAQAWGFLTDTYPVFITEFGNVMSCDPDYSSDVVDYAATRGLSWTAWAWYVGGCEFPSLITDWSGTPSPEGQVVRAALQ